MKAWKTCLLLLFVATSYASDDEGMKSCITDENCGHGECCISMAFLRGFCHTKGDVGSHCITAPTMTEHGKKNNFGCPCKDGLVCTPGIVEKKSDGVVVWKNLACQAALE